MASQSQGIQKLLEAEKEATRLVEEARKYKLKRLKEAKNEAKAETESFQAERSAKFDQVSSDSKNAQIEKSIEAEIDAIILEMDVRVKKNLKRVVDDLVGGIKHIQLDLPRNYATSATAGQ